MEAPAMSQLADAARLTGANAARELRYTTDSPPPSDGTARRLHNLGNTCYGNALLAVLSKIPHVRRWCHERLHAALTPPLHPGHCPLCMLARDIDAINSPETPVAHWPEVLMQRRTWNLAFDNNTQQDANGAFQTLLGRCDDVDASAVWALPLCSHMDYDNFNKSTYRATTPYQQIFGDLEFVRFKCTACNATSDKYERAHTQEISLANKNHTSLDVLFADHFGREVLDADYTCANCPTMAAD